MKRIVIIGGGFGGLNAVRGLRTLGGRAERALIDRRETSDFLPLLPDVISERATGRNLQWPLEREAREQDCRFVHAEVEKLDLDAGHVVTSQGGFDYDYCVLACGTATNFSSNEDARAHAYTLDDVDDAERLHRRLGRGDCRHVVVVGGGYTGLEIATAARLFFTKRRMKRGVAVVELAQTLLPELPAWMQEYAHDNLKRMDIDVINGGATLKRCDARTVELTDGKVFEDAVLVWTAGVRTPDFVRALDVERGRGGRVAVDAHLRLRDRCFVVGDAAGRRGKRDALRMAVQFARVGGTLAAENIIRHLDGRDLLEMHPVDPGYIIPMANSRSCGVTLGVPTRGAPPTLLHYLMSTLRTQGLGHKLGVLKDVMFGR